MALPDYILVHVAVPVEYDEPQLSTPEWIEGEPGPQDGGQATDGEPFVCVLFLPSAGGEQSNQYRPRVVQQPTMLHNTVRDTQRPAAGGAPAVPADGSAIALARESEVLITAPELEPWTGASTVRWQLVGDEQPFGPPGRIIGALAALRQVQD